MNSIDGRERAETHRTSLVRAAKGSARKPKPRQPARSPQPSRARVAIAVALAAVAAAAWLQFVFFQHAGALWRDEINSVYTSAFSSVADLWRRLEFESTPV